MALKTYMCFQDMIKCSPKGRDCIEGNWTRSFNCSLTCEGIYAGIQWVEEGMGIGEAEDELAAVVSNEKIGEDQNTDMFRRLKKMELMYNDLKNEVTMMKSKFGKKGEELDKEKYLKLIAEYKNFKKKNVQHFRFSSAANLSNFGKSES